MRYDENSKQDRYSQEQAFKLREEISDLESELNSVDESDRMIAQDVYNELASARKKLKELERLMRQN